MTNEATGGVSKRSLVLLGAFAALALNRDVRRGLVQGTRDAVSNAQGTLDDTVKPALSSAAQHTGQTVGHLLEGATHTLDTLREEAPGRAHTLLDAAQEVAGTVAATAAARAAQARKDAGKATRRARKEYGPRLGALGEDLLSSVAAVREEAAKAAQEARKEYAPRLGALSEDLRDLAEDRRHDAQKALKNAGKSGRGVIGHLGQKASTLLDDMNANLQDEREDIEYRVRRARRKAERDLRRSGKGWSAKKLQKAVDRQVAPLRKQADRQLALLEKRAARNARSSRQGASGPGLGGGTLLLLGGGAVALARLPQARQAMMDAVDTVSPVAAAALHGAGQKIRGVVGDFWLERDAMKSSTAIVPYSEQQSTFTSTTPGTADLDSRPPAADKNGSPTRPT